MVDNILMAIILATLAVTIYFIMRWKIRNKNDMKLLEYYFSVIQSNTNIIQKLAENHSMRFNELEELLKSEPKSPLQEGIELNEGIRAHEEVEAYKKYLRSRREN
jgi:hypothetical protein